MLAGRSCVAEPRTEVLAVGPTMDKLPSVAVTVTPSVPVTMPAVDNAKLRADA